MSKLVGIDGKAVETVAEPVITPKEPVEKAFSFQMNDGTDFTAVGILVITPAFVGLGDKDGSEIRAVVPLSTLKFVHEVATAGVKSSGTLQ